MTYTLVRSSVASASLLLKGTRTMDLAHFVASAFTESSLELEVHFRLAEIFGPHKFSWYAIDCSSSNWIITFSNAANPKALSYQGVPARIASQDAAFLALELEDIESYRLGALPRHVKTKHFIGETK